MDFTADDGTSVIGRDYGFITRVYDVDNNTPQVQIPPLWKIMAGCPEQKLNLNPIDLDNDKIRQGLDKIMIEARSNKTEIKK